MANIAINKAQIDWLTVTSFEMDLGWPLLESIYDELESSKQTLDAKRMQYLGKASHFENGDLFIGQAEQNGRFHLMLQCSGDVSEIVYEKLRYGLSEGWLRCRRIDLQITILQPEDWSQWRFFNRVKRSGRIPGWHESHAQDGTELATVYVGSRKSNKLLRVYQKWAESLLLLRYEVEYKGRKAESIGKELARGNFEREQMLMFHVQQLGDNQLSAYIEPKLAGVIDPAEPKAVQTEGNTIKWLKESVYPAFVRVINDHSAGGDVAELFIDALRRSGYT